VYAPGKRHWLKMKKDYLGEGEMADTADLVCLLSHRALLLCLCHRGRYYACYRIARCCYVFVIVAGIWVRVRHAAYITYSHAYYFVD